MVKVAIVLPVLLGVLGLVIDLGLMFSTHRQAQNAADAGALAAATDKMGGKTDAVALVTAQTFIQQYNALATAVPLVAGTSFNTPPTSGAYAGKANYVEVRVSVPANTFFIQVLGLDSHRTVGARAVAGYEPVGSSVGCTVLDPSARPGLKCSSGSASVRVNGGICINSNGGGVDEHGASVPGSGTGVSAGKGGIYATSINVCGGVDSPANFHPYVTGAANPLHCRSAPVADSLINLPTPTTGNGVYNVSRGYVACNGGTALVGDYGTPRNHVAVRGENLPDGTKGVAGQCILYPGVYTDINISSGATVRFMPGIYVLRPLQYTGGGDVMTISGGTVTGTGVMIYNTGHNYNASTGGPDAQDAGQSLPAADGPTCQRINVTTSTVTFTPINTKDTTLTYSPAVSGAFDGMLVCQRRRNPAQITLAGGNLSGSLYAKWAPCSLSGQGTNSCQFTCGSVDVTGGGTVSMGDNSQASRASRVFLVE